VRGVTDATIGLDRARLASRPFLWVAVWATVDLSRLVGFRPADPCRVGASSRNGRCRMGQDLLYIPSLKVETGSPVGTTVGGGALRLNRTRILAPLVARLLVVRPGTASNPLPRLAQRFPATRQGPDNNLQRGS
jgi:hypothetical protein